MPIDTARYARNPMPLQVTASLNGFLFELLHRNAASRMVFPLQTHRNPCARSVRSNHKDLLEIRMIKTAHKSSIWKAAGAVALLAVAPALMVSPANAFGHGGGGHGGGGGFHGGGGGFHSGAAAFRGSGSAGVRSSFASTNVAGAHVAAANNMGRGGWSHGSHMRGGRGYGYGYGFGAGYGVAPYGYYDDGYDSAYYDNGDYDYGPNVAYGSGEVVAAAPADPASCAQIYRSYDPASGTYLGYDGMRHPCP
jgi:hypothetical protein